MSFQKQNISKQKLTILKRKVRIIGVICIMACIANSAFQVKFIQKEENI